MNHLLLGGQPIQIDQMIFFLTTSLKLAISVFLNFTELLPCELPWSRFSVSQNFCSSLKYLSRMYTFDVPIPAILTTGGHHWLSSAHPAPISPYLGLPPKSGASQSPKSVFPPGLLSHILETVKPAGRPSTGCSPMGAPHRAKRPNSGAHHCSALLPTSTTTWLHVTRVPAVVGGSR